jgi:hypothetical protein
VTGVFEPQGRSDGAYRNAVFLFLVGATLLSAGIFVALGQPDIPYNFASLFLHGYSLVNIVLFAIALLWIGLGGTLAARLATASRPGLALLPLWVVLAALVSYALISNSVTDESIRDIVGSPVLFRDVTVHGEWGRLGAAIVAVFERKSTVDTIETIVRYVALYSTVTLCIVAAVGISMIPGTRRAVWVPAAIRRRAWFLIYAAIWAYVFKIVVIDYAATNNITELIAPTAWGIVSGLLPLYMLFALMAANAVFVARVVVGGWRSVAHVAVVTPFALICGWYLLNSGLVQSLHKYDLTYSGVDFLLGPDREKLLPQHILLVRWAVIYAVVVIGLGFGIAVGRSARSRSAAARP